MVIDMIYIQIKKIRNDNNRINIQSNYECFRLIMTTKYLMVFI